MKRFKKFFITLMGSVILSQSLIAFASLVNTYKGWENTSGPVWLSNTNNNIYYNSSNDVGGIQKEMRASYSYNTRRKRVLNYKLRQNMIYTPDKDTGYNIDIYRFTDVIHPDGRMGYTRWFDSPYGVYLDYQASRMKDNLSLEDTVITDTISYNQSINNTNSYAFVATTDITSNGFREFGDAKSASIILDEKIFEGDIYLSGSGNVDSRVIEELKSRNKKDVYLLGGFGTFNNTALFTDGFNVIRIGGPNRQDTLNYSLNMPDKIKNPVIKEPNSGTGLIIEGLSSSDNRYSTVLSFLNRLRDTHDMSYLASAFDYLLNGDNIGSIGSVTSSSSPIITIGVNYNGWHTYCSIYGTLKAGRGYVYNVVAPGYFENPTSQSVTVRDYEYEDSTTKWVKLADEFKICNTISAYKDSIVSINNYLDNELNYDDRFTNYFVSKVGSSINSYPTVNGFEAPSTKPSISSSQNSGMIYNYNMCVPTKVIDKKLNGQKFVVWGNMNVGEVNDSSSINETTYVRDSKLLGIDAVGPAINYDTTGEIDIIDYESGFSKVVVTQNGSNREYTSSSIKIDLSVDTNLTAYDNVGNVTVLEIPAIPDDVEDWQGSGYIKTRKDVLNGKYILRYWAKADFSRETFTLRYKHWYTYPVYETNEDGDEVFSHYEWDYYIDTRTETKDPINLTFAWSSQYDGSSSTTTTGSINYQDFFEDKVNTSSAPNLKYENNKSTYSKITWSHIEDLVDSTHFTLRKQWSYKDSLNNFSEDDIIDEVYRDFCSGRKDYKWVLYQTADRYGNNITKTKVSEGRTEGTEVDMSNYKTGAYEIEVTMYDKNENPSGTAVLSFKHVQPEINTDITDLFLKVTAVKDLNWESMDYPIKYNSLEFPLGKNLLSKTGEGIKLGYVVNFSIENMIKHNLSDWNATYTLLGENGELLSATSNGKTLKESDTKDGTGYLYQPKKQILSDKDPSPDSSNNGYADRLFFKHFIPADAEFFKTDGSVYRGKVTVRVKIYLKEVGTDGKVGENTYTVGLYTIDTSDSAYDDLNIDKQR